ncbi:hypothetical protein C8J55DRAFT_556477 [Lentinula edodes]|uniref:Uncharacterized protein n=1 Tax=Lentinula lateritia TaxID=40482 RepID=A0A9W9DZ83_9AGAR|nr:hypothetical protein C8J55DRAFT_556477 [Lentinula edodes]
MPEESFANFFIRFNEYTPLTGFDDEALVTYLKKGVAPWLPLQVVTGREEPQSYDEWTQVFTKLDGAGGSKIGPTGKKDDKGLPQLGAKRKTTITKVEGKRKTAATVGTGENGPKRSFGQELPIPGGNGLPKKEWRSGEDEDRSSACIVDERSTGQRTVLTQNHRNDLWRNREAQRELPKPIQLEEKLPNAYPLGELPFPKPPRAPQLLRKLWDLDVGNVEAAPHIELRIASPLPPPTLEDDHPQTSPPGTYPPWHIPSRELTPSRPSCINYLLDPILTF